MKDDELLMNVILGVVFFVGVCAGGYLMEYMYGAKKEKPEPGPSDREDDGEPPDDFPKRQSMCHRCGHECDNYRCRRCYY